MLPVQDQTSILTKYTKMSSVDIFSLKYYKTVYADYMHVRDVVFPKIKDEIEQSKINNNPTMVNGTICTYNQYDQINQLPEAKELVKFAEAEAQKFWAELNYSSLLTPKLIQMWANKQPKGGSVRSHLHGSMPLTAVLYLNAKEGMGNIVLENPLESLLVSQPMDYQAQAFLHCEIKVKSGDFVMFPGWMRHYVQPNTLDEDRLVVAMNFGSTGNYLTGQWLSVR